MSNPLHFIKRLFSETTKIYCEKDYRYITILYTTDNRFFFENPENDPLVGRKTNCKSFYIGNNKIKTMNGVDFANLPQLVELDLERNVCIDRKFMIDRSSNTFRRRISRNCPSTDATGKQIACKSSIGSSEGIEKLFSNRYNRSAGCCTLQHKTIIDSPDYTFANNLNYRGLEMLHIFHQRNVEFLPVLVHETFPILKFYRVVSTPIQKVFRKNFEKLNRLEMLHLEQNQIDVIKNDTFEDLVNLKEIFIGDKKLALLL